MFSFHYEAVWCCFSEMHFHERWHRLIFSRMRLKTFAINYYSQLISAGSFSIVLFDEFHIVLRRQPSPHQQCRIIPLVLYSIINTGFFNSTVTQYFISWCDCCSSHWSIWLGTVCLLFLRYNYRFMVRGLRRIRRCHQPNSCRRLAVIHVSVHLTDFISSLCLKLHHWIKKRKSLLFVGLS